MDKNLIVLVLLGILILFVGYQFLQLNSLNAKVDASSVTTSATAASASGGLSDYEKMMQEHHGGK